MIYVLQPQFSIDFVRPIRRMKSPWKKRILLLFSTFKNCVGQNKKELTRTDIYRTIASGFLLSWGMEPSLSTNMSRASFIHQCLHTSLASAAVNCNTIVCTLQYLESKEIVTTSMISWMIRRLRTQILWRSFFSGHRSSSSLTNRGNMCPS